MILLIIILSKNLKIYGVTGGIAMGKTLFKQILEEKNQSVI